MDGVEIVDNLKWISWLRNFSVKLCHQFESSALEVLYYMRIDIYIVNFKMATTAL